MYWQDANKTRVVDTSGTKKDITRGVDKTWSGSGFELSSNNLKYGTS